MISTEGIILRQDATLRANEKMLAALLNYEPCRILTVGDVKWISEWVSTFTFAAIEEVDEKEGRK